MNHIFKIIVLLFIGIQVSQAQLIINEVSQGPAGSQEYVEFLVIGNPTCSSSTVDIRGWVFDDNNSWHAAGAGNGIASGHKRFSNAAQWSNIRMGSLIVIYNETDPNPSLPADDETDSNHDCVYILPSSSALLDHNTTVPSGTLVFTTYAGATYTSSGNWNSLSMNNTNDAFHTVNPLAINGPYHAIGWGTNVDSNDVYYPGNMSNRVVRFLNTIDNNAFNPLNFSRDTALLGGSIESPGLANSLANASYINYMKNSCLPFTAINLIVDTSICSGNYVFAGGALRNTNGSYYDTLRGLGCDTIKRTNLSVLAVPTTSQSVSICFGETVLINGIPRSTPNLYRDTINSFTGCDSIVNTTLIVDSVKRFTRNVSICDGGSYFAGGANRYVGGTYYDSLIAGSGCDSILTTILRINPNSTSNTFLTVCSATPCPLWGGIGCCYTGNYFDTLTNYLGCDSIALLILTIATSNDTIINQTICNGVIIRIGSSIYNSNGTYYDTLVNTSGCDSLVQLNLIVNPISTRTIDTSICQGNTIRVGSSIYTTSGTYYDTLVNFTSCDSIVRTNLTVLNLSSNRSLNICNGDSLFLGGAWRNTSGIYYDTLVGRLGCDSILRSTLSVNAPTVTSFRQSLCLGDLYLGNLYTSDTTWTTSHTNRFGCDSTHTITLTVNPVPTITIGADTCITVGESITLSASGGFDYFWSTGINNSSITVSPTQTTTYFVQGINVQLCSGYDTITICVNEFNDSSSYAIPSAFTPNGDGLNDVFKILSTYNLNLESMQIFNRWGELVFETKNSASGWNGMFREREQPIGSYVYSIQLRNTINNNIENYTGTVTLIR